jgi:zinc transport system substrate-binding protein
VRKALLLIGVILVVLFIFFLVNGQQGPTKKLKPFVAVSSFPLYEIATRLSAGEIEVRLLMPFGVDTHTFMPSVKTMQTMMEADLVFYNGLGLEPWMSEVKEHGVNMSQFVQILHPAHEEHEEKHEHHHHHEDGDPHYWLDSDNMIQMTQVISSKLIAMYPDLKQKIESEVLEYTKALQDLDGLYRTQLSHCQRDEIVLNHNAFVYLAHRYGFHTHTLRGLSSDEQVSAKKMREMTDLIREEDMKVIFYESFVSPKVAQTIANETGIELMSLHPLANVSEAEAAKGYTPLMKENLKKLVYAMECQ